MAQDKKYCTDCGQLILARAEICPFCGVRQPAIGNNKENRTKLTAGLLALFLGWIGIHKFYLGQKGLGIIYLIFFWTFIPGIISLIEAIIYLSMSQQNFDAKYNH